MKNLTDDFSDRCRFHYVSQANRDSQFQTHFLRASLARCENAANTEVIFVSWDDDVSSQPFFVAVDKSKDVIIVSVRGTMSRSDVISDMVCDEVPISHGVPGKCHKGVLDCALQVEREISANQLLEMARQRLAASGKSGSKVMIVGHSLGAGIATVLAMILHRRPSPFAVECVAFAPPGGLLTKSAVDYSKTLVTSVVVGDDLVPRLGMAQLERLKHEMSHCLKRSKAHKWNIIFSSVFG